MELFRKNQEKIRFGITLLVLVIGWLILLVGTILILQDRVLFPINGILPLIGIIILAWYLNKVKKEPYYDQFTKNYEVNIVFFSLIILILAWFVFLFAVGQFIQDGELLKVFSTIIAAVVFAIFLIIANGNDRIKTLKDDHPLFLIWMSLVFLSVGWGFQFWVVGQLLQSIPLGTVWPTILGTFMVTISLVFSQNSDSVENIKRSHIEYLVKVGLFTLVLSWGIILTAAGLILVDPTKRSYLFLAFGLLFLIIGLLNLFNRPWMEIFKIDHTNYLLVVGFIIMSMGWGFLLWAATQILQGDAEQKIWPILVGTVCMVTGFYILVIQDRTTWPEVTILLLVLGAIFLGTNSRSFLREISFETTQLPIEVDKFVSGTELLAVEKAVEIVVYLPNTSSTPVKHLATFGKVIDTGEQAIILEVAAADAAALEAAMVFDEAQVAYHFLTAVPTPTLTPTPTTTPMSPTGTPSPLDHYVYLEFDSDLVYPRANLLETEKGARLIIIEKISESKDDGQTGQVEIETLNECVFFRSFLDVKGVRQSNFIQSETKKVLIEIDSGIVSEIARGITRAERIFLIVDNSCHFALPATMIPTPQG